MALKVGGLAAGFIIDYVIASIVGSFEREIAEIDRPRIIRLWRENVYTRIEDKVQAFVDLEPHVPASGRMPGFTGLGDRQYIHVRWEIVTRLQAEDSVADTAVWVANSARRDARFRRVARGRPPCEPPHHAIPPHTNISAALL